MPSVRAPYICYIRTDEEIPIPVSPPLVIGTAEDAGLSVKPVLEHGISGRHAEIYYRMAEKKVVIKDIGNPENCGTFINNKQIGRQVEEIVFNKDRIRIGAWGGEEFMVFYEEPYRAGDITLEGEYISVRGTLVYDFDLGPVDRKILELLLANAPLAVTYEELAGAWAVVGDYEEYDPHDRGRIQKAVQRLRSGLDDLLGLEGSIKAVNRRGYRLDVYPLS